MKDKDREALDVRKRSIFSSSAESLESYDDSLSISTQEQLYDNIRLHKEIIQSVKLEPWSLSKKYKIVQKAKQYVARHEDTLQERFAQSGNTKDLYARFKIVLADVRKKLILGCDTFAEMFSSEIKFRGHELKSFKFLNFLNYFTRDSPHD